MRPSSSARSTKSSLSGRVSSRGLPLNVMQLTLLSVSSVSKSLDLRLWADVLAGHGLRSRSPSTCRNSPNLSWVRACDLRCLRNVSVNLSHYLVGFFGASFRLPTRATAPTCHRWLHPRGSPFGDG